MLTSEEEGEVESYQILRPRGSEWNYTITRKIGEGTFGKVFLCTAHGKSYALKSISYEASHNGLPLTTLREIKILKSLKHPSIIEIIEIVVKNFHAEKFDRRVCEVFLVLPYLKTDLHALIQKAPLPGSEVRHIFEQMVSGMVYLKSQGIIHRDLKTSNILVDDNYNIRIADFGLAKRCAGGYNTPGVVTLWYRPPEILLGSDSYSYSADVWALGCILGEMLLGKAVFRGNNEVTQLEAIIRGCGSIGEGALANMCIPGGCPPYKLPQSPRNLGEMFRNSHKDVVNTLNLMLVADPTLRCSVEDLQEHRYVQHVGVSGERSPKARRVM